MAEYIERKDAMDAVLVGDIDKDFPCMDIAARLHDIPAADVRPVVLCKDCYWWTKQEASVQGRCSLLEMYPSWYWFCANGRKRADMREES